MKHRAVENNTEIVKRAVSYGTVLNLTFDNEVEAVDLLSNDFVCSKLTKLRSTISFSAYPKNHHKKKVLFIIANGKTVALTVDTEADVVEIKEHMAEEPCQFSLGVVAQLYGRTYNSIAQHTPNPTVASRTIVIGDTRFIAIDELLYVHRVGQAQCYKALGTGSLAVRVEEDLFSITLQDKFFHISACYKRAYRSR